MYSTSEIFMVILKLILVLQTMGNQLNSSPKKRKLTSGMEDALQRARTAKKARMIAVQDENAPPAVLTEMPLAESLIRLKIPGLDEQLDAYRKREVDPMVPAKSTLKRKQDKVEVLTMAIARYRARRRGGVDARSSYHCGGVFIDTSLTS
ncbi:hypothetical protein BC628DRAFT_1338826 [Trametes gibbosa]|nr:hypothetical protein BC628DRAFT_1338826 [Trametes gibbosa]